MHYRAVGNRCAVHFQSLALDLPDNYTEDIFLEILGYLGFCSIKVDVVFIARALLGVPSYRLGASLSEAPQFFDCSSFTKYLYAQKGIWIPRLSVQQRIQGMVVDTPVPGDLVFTTSFQNNYEMILSKMSDMLVSQPRMGLSSM